MLTYLCYSLTFINPERDYAEYKPTADFVEWLASDATSVHEVNIVYADESIAFEKKGENILIRYPL